MKLSEILETSRIKSPVMIKVVDGQEELLLTLHSTEDVEAFSFLVGSEERSLNVIEWDIISEPHEPRKLFVKVEKSNIDSISPLHYGPGVRSVNQSENSLKYKLGFGDIEMDTKVE